MERALERPGGEARSDRDVRILVVDDHRVVRQGPAHVPCFGAIVGARSPRQVDGWIAAGVTELTSAEMEEIATSVGATGAGRGPALPAVLG
jgi:hypothetical protein